MEARLFPSEINLCSVHLRSCFCLFPPTELLVLEGLPLEFLRPRTGTASIAMYSVKEQMNPVEQGIDGDSPDRKPRAFSLKTLQGVPKTETRSITLGHLQRHPQSITSPCLTTQDALAAHGPRRLPKTCIGIFVTASVVEAPSWRQPQPPTTAERTGRLPMVSPRVDWWAAVKQKCSRRTNTGDYPRLLALSSLFFLFF